MITIKIAIVGIGTVGKGVLDILQANSFYLNNNSPFSLVALCSKSIDSKFLKENYFICRNSSFYNDYQLMLDSEKIDLIIELIGGTTSSYNIIDKSLSKGIHVITANKAVLEKYGLSIFEKAVKLNCLLGIEASVCGGIPIIKIIREALIVDKVKAVYGIINGTTNYILSKMMNDKIDFDDALRLAQEKGFAEQDPTLDINGYDVCHKASILAMLAFNTHVDTKNIYVEGIEHIKQVDLEMSNEMGYKLKFLSILKNTENGLDIRVHPTLVSKKEQIADVEDEYNALFLKSEFLTNSFYYGKGAGAFPTANSVVNDILFISKYVALTKKQFSEKNNNLNSDEFKNLLYETFLPIKIKKTYQKTIPIEEITSAFYVRILVEERKGILANITDIFSKYSISIASINQKETFLKNELNLVNIFILSYPIKEANMKNALKEIFKLEAIKQLPVFYRVL